MNILEKVDLYFVCGGVKDDKFVQSIGQDIMDELDGPFKTDQDGMA